MVATINEKLLNDVIQVVKLAERTTNTAVVGEGNDNEYEEYTILNDISANDDFDQSDSLATTTKALSSLDISRKKDESGSQQHHETRRGRRRSQIIKDSISSLFSTPSSPSSTSSSTFAPRRSYTQRRLSSPRSSRRFSLTSMVSRQRRLLTIKRKNKNRSKRWLSAAHISMEASTAFRQSSSTAFTSAALEVSESIRLPREEDEEEDDVDDDDCVDSPFHQFLLDHAHASH